MEGGRPSRRGTRETQQTGSKRRISLGPGGNNPRKRVADFDSSTDGESETNSSPSASDDELTPVTPARRPASRSHGSSVRKETSVAAVMAAVTPVPNRIAQLRRKSGMGDTSPSAFMSPLGRPTTVPVGVSPGTPGLRNFSMEEMQKSFDEYLKIVANNRINASNTWNLALIDYFQDMRVLREGESVNFQKASFTLDGCVKVYSSRVDAVDTEVRRLLNGLSDKSGGSFDSNPAEKKKRATKHTETIAKDPSSINVKEFELDFTVDPLFNKMRADFDEGGARGLLLNHLCIAPEGQIIFDTTDFFADMESTVEGLDEKLGIGYELPPNSGKKLADISKLKELFGKDLSDIWNRQLCPTFSTFTFGNDASAFNLDSLAFLDNEPPSLTRNDDDNDFGRFDDNPFDTGNPAFDDGDDDDDDDGFDIQLDAHDLAAETGPPDMGTIMNSMKDVEDEPGGPGGDDIDQDAEINFQYFDETMVRNWAGLEHFRPKRVREAPKEAETGATVTKVKRARKSKKEIPEIDFLSDKPFDLKALFVTSKSIDMPKTKGPIKPILLPEDHHYSIHSFLRLFTNPNRKLTLRKKNGRKIRVDNEITANALSDLHDEPVVSAAEQLLDDEDQPVNELGAENYYFNDDGSDDDGDDGGLPAFDADPAEEHPHRGDGEPLVDIEELPADAPLPLDFGSQLVQEPRRIRVSTIRFARQAKRVDVKKLKDNMWDIIEETGVVESIKGKEPAREQSEVLKFSDVKKSLAPKYHPKILKDISTPFCFICLLHLANEKGLTIVNEEKETANYAGLTNGWDTGGGDGVRWTGRELIVRRDSSDETMEED
ncbi:condensin complex subunit 2-domain-containing protein [Cladochytrium replicatum]|nr:condensin complex subunit 2-domain-containing protein [Cladochytrium replicatum]